MYKIIMIYIIVSIILFCIIKEYKPNASRQIKQYYLNGFFFLLALVMGLRGMSVGVDTENYRYIFEIIAKVPFEQLLGGFFYGSQEIGFVLYTKIIAILWNNYQFYLVVSAFLFCYLFKHFIERSTDDYFIASIIFLSVGIYLAAFNITRQMLAVAFLANSWSCFKDEKYIKALLITVLATTFHVSALLYILAYIVYYFRNNITIMRLVPVLLILFYFSFEVLFGSITPYLAHYDNYLANVKTIQSANTVMVLWLLESIISLFFIYGSKASSVTETRFISCMSILYVIMNLIGLRFNYIERLGLYFSPFLMLLFCKLSNSIHNRLIKDIFFIGLTICFLIYFILSTQTDQYIYNSPILKLG